MENKQTAVDFIFSQLPDEYTTTRQGFEVYTQAKAMDKEQRLQDMILMQCITDVDYDGNVKFMFKPIEYFEEKYGKTFIDLVSDEESKVHEVVRKLKEKKEETLCERTGHLPSWWTKDNTCMICKQDITEWLKNINK
jgi:hypothetical protein